jgi:hypothetical protein
MVEGAMADHEQHQYVIDPRNYCSYRSYTWQLAIFWLIWVSLTAVVTYFAFTRGNAFLFVWLIVGYLGTIAVPFAICCRNRKQVIDVRGDSLVISGTGPLPMSKVRIEKADLQALTLEQYGGAGDGESVYTLNLLSQRGGWINRVILAPFVHPAGKLVLLEEIEAFLRRHGFVFSVKNGCGRPKPPEPKP